jgi:hypothetical protein
MDSPNEECAVDSPETPRIVTDWKRLACGLWRMPQGDISAAYCGDTFPKLKVFSHEGKTYINGGNLFSGIVRAFMTCYPLILPEEYRGPELVQYSYEGKTGTLKGKPFRLGPKVIFASNDPTVEEWTRMLRVIYADGGLFVHGLTYREFLERPNHVRKTLNECAAIEAELAYWASSHLPETQEAMIRFLEGAAAASLSPAHPQLELSL